MLKKHPEHYDEPDLTARIEAEKPGGRAAAR
jgi:hypothetical protein